MLTVAVDSGSEGMLPDLPLHSDPAKINEDPHIRYFTFFVMRETHAANYPITDLDSLLGFQEVEAPRIFRQLAYKGGKVVSPTN